MMTTELSQRAGMIGKAFSIARDPSRVSYSIDELEGEQAFHAVRDDWNMLWNESIDATHFQLWEWQYLYWKHLMPSSIPRFMMLRDPDGRIRAIALLVLSRDPATGLMTTGFIGEMRSDYNMILAGKHVPLSEGVVLLSAIIERSKSSSAALSLTSISENSWTAQVIQFYQSREGQCDSLFRVFDTESYSMPLPSSVDDYVMSLGLRARRHFGYERRRLAKTCAIEFQVHEGRDVSDKVIDQIEEVDLARWGCDSMYQRPARRTFERCVIKMLSERGILRVFLLSLEGKAAAFAWCAVVRGIVEIDRVAYDPSIPSRLSVGKVANYFAIEECIRRGYTEFDLGRGGEAYKSWLGARAKKLFNLQVHRSRLDHVVGSIGHRLISRAHKQQWLRHAYRKLL